VNLYSVACEDRMEFNNNPACCLQLPSRCASKVHIAQRMSAPSLAKNSAEQHLESSSKRGAEKIRDISNSIKTLRFRRRLTKGSRWNNSLHEELVVV
jgi:hypothetical protein